MIYRAIGLMSGSSLDGLDIACVEFTEQAGKWSFEIVKTGCYPYPEDWADRLRGAVDLSAREYQLLHTEYGHYTGQLVNQFIEAHQLQYTIALVSSHGHTSFHLPARKMTAQLGDGAAIAAETKLPVVSDLRAMDIAFGGQGAPIVPIGEKILLPEYDLFLNIGGIANISFRPHPNPIQKERASKPPSHIGERSLGDEVFIAFDVCPANRVLNMLANDAGKSFDTGGEMAASGIVNTQLLETLNALEYYRKPYPKSLANDFGTGILYPIIKKAGISTANALRTCTEHIAIQVGRSAGLFKNQQPAGGGRRLLVTGGGAFNHFLVSRIGENLKDQEIETVVPSEDLVNYKEAVIMAFIGVLRWRQENNVMASVTGASRNSIGGALWTGQEA